MSELRDETLWDGRPNHFLMCKELQTSLDSLSAMQGISMQRHHSHCTVFSQSTFLFASFSHRDKCGQSVRPLKMRCFHKQQGQLTWVQTGQKTFEKPQERLEARLLGAVSCSHTCLSKIFYFPCNRRPHSQASSQKKERKKNRKRGLALSYSSISIQRGRQRGPQQN